MYSAMSAHVKEYQMVEISRALYHGVPHNHVVILASKTPDIVIYYNLVE